MPSQYSLGYSYTLIYGNLFKGYRSQQEMLQSPYVSPAWYGLSEAQTGEASFERWPPTYISAGGGESESAGLYKVSLADPTDTPCSAPERDRSAARAHVPHRRR